MKILIVEDDADLREITTRSLEKERYVVSQAPDYRTALCKIEDYDYDCILLDIMLPGGSGLDLLRELKRLHRSDSVLIISAKDSLDDKVDGLELGADDYLTKPFSVLELISRVRAILRRCTVEEKPETVELGGIVLDDSKHIVTSNGEQCSLTYKEYELLKYLLNNKGMALTRENIIINVWGYDFEGESRTVDMHITTLRQKLGECGNLIKTVRNVGYKAGE